MIRVLTAPLAEVPAHGKHAEEDAEEEKDCRIRVVPNSVLWLRDFVLEVTDPSSKLIGIFVIHHGGILHYPFPTLLAHADNHNYLSFDEVREAMDLVFQERPKLSIVFFVQACRSRLSSPHEVESSHSLSGVIVSG